MAQTINRVAPAYKAGRKVGAAGQINPDALNPYPHGCRERGDWRVGYGDGWADTGEIKARMRDQKSGGTKKTK